MKTLGVILIGGPLHGQRMPSELLSAPGMKVGFEHVFAVTGVSEPLHYRVPPLGPVHESRTDDDNLFELHFVEQVATP